MYCEETQHAIEVSNFGTGTLQLSALCQAHLSECRDCQEYAKEYALPDILRAVTHTAVPDRLEQRILGQTAGQAVNHNSSPLWWMMSAAATIVLVVTLAVVDLFRTPQTIPTYVQVSVDQVQPVRVMLASKTSLQDAQLRVAMSDNIAVSGFDNLRELSWVTNLKEGNNLLVLPIQLLQPSNGRIEVVLEHQGASKSYVINVSPKQQTESESIPI